MRTAHIKILLLACGLAACLTASPSRTQAQDLPDDLLTAELRPGWAEANGTRIAALHLRLAPGWKTYWRAPGEAGIPPLFDWSGSQNVGAVAFHWPTPTPFRLNGLLTLGYKHELVLPIEITPRDRGAPVRLRARVDLGVCDEVCVPTSIEVASDLNGKGGDDPLIRAALAQVPRPARQAGLSAARCDVAPIRDGLRLTARLTMPALGGTEVAAVEARPGIWVSPASTQRQGGTLTVTADLVPADARPFALNRSDLRFTVLGAKGRAVDLQGCGS